MYGPPVPVREDAVGQIIVGVDTKVGANEPGADVPIGGEEFRRSVYIEVRRSKPLALLRAFDAARDGNQLRPPHRVDGRSASPDDDEQRVHAHTGEPVRRTLETRRRPDLRQKSHACLRAGLRPARPTRPRLDQSLAFLQLQTDQVEDPSRSRSDASAETCPRRATGQKESPPKYETMQRSTAAEPSLQPLTDFCQALLSSNEFLYVD